MRSARSAGVCSLSQETGPPPTTAYRRPRARAQAGQPVWGRTTCSVRAAAASAHPGFPCHLYSEVSRVARCAWSDEVCPIAAFSESAANKSAAGSNATRVKPFSLFTRSSPPPFSTERW